MSNEQQIMLQKVGNKLKEVRNILDDIMYRMMPLSDSEHKKIREGYDLICKANDKLF
jgi:hypothetical protein